MSAIVWLRRHVTSESQSAIYFAALAINDLVYIGASASRYIVNDRWWSLISYGISWSTAILEALLVLSFSVVRFIAIRRPLQVC